MAKLRQQDALDIPDKTTRLSAVAFAIRCEGRTAIESVLSLARRFATRTYDFGISFSTTWSMLKLAALARGGNSLKLSSHFPSIGGAEYSR